MVLTKENVIKYNFERNQTGKIRVYQNHDIGTIFSKNGNEDIEFIKGTDGNPDRQVRKNITAKGHPEWQGTAAYEEHWEKIRYCINKIKAKYKTVDNWKKNIEHMPAGTEDLFDLMRKDITRNIMEEADYTPFIANVVNDPDFDNPTYAQWLYDYVAPFKEFSGQGQKVNMVYTRLGDKTPIEFILKGIGFESDLYNLMFNRIFSMQKVNVAIARFYIYEKNDEVLAPIIGFNYPDNKLIELATGTNLSQEDITYTTILNAIIKLGQLLNFQTKQEINVLSGLLLMCHSTRVLEIGRAINGILQNGVQVRNLTALTQISKILPYNTKRFKYFEEDITFTGCGADDFYLMVPKENYWYLMKRGLTHITGPGDTFSGSSTKEAWYYCRALYYDQFLGGDADDPADEAAAGDTETITQEHGYVVKGALPSLVEET